MAIPHLAVPIRNLSCSGEANCLFVRPDSLFALHREFAGKALKPLHERKSISPEAARNQ
jgi:hypothetical protein